ncbi:transglycosylase SLT domain-containing protein [Elioraea sp.]|uniref:transglycosylase SLT domain-containing protein n=1 Tax=Elioraea sp. TaxID=2185103 RepID=UPI003F6F6D80
MAAARTAEAVAGLPDGLLVSVAVVESALHPYAVGSERDARYARSPAQAKQAARAMAPGARSVSGGCFQVNIGVHARDGAAWVFDPAESAGFAARLLTELHARHGGWAAALAAYNGASPGGSVGRAYACRVRAALAEAAPASLPAIRLDACPAGATRAIRAKAATLLAMAGADDDQLAEAEAR